MLFLLALAMVVLAQQQTITIGDAQLDPNARCEIYTGSLCAPYYGSNTLIYVNSTLDQIQREQGAQVLIGPLTFIQDEVPENCVRTASAYACAVWFPPCMNVSGVALPQETCANFTDETNEFCAQVFDAFHLPPIDYAPHIIYNLSAVNGPASFAPPCLTSSDYVVNSSSCVPPNQLINGDCIRARECPLRVYPKKHVDIVHIVFAVLCWIGLSISLFLIIVIALDPERRDTYPSAGFFFAIICFFVCTFSFTFSSWVGYEDLQCRYTRLCKAQGVLTSLATLGASCWLAVSFCFVLVKLIDPMFARKINTHWYKHLFHLYPWSVAIVFTAIYPSAWQPVWGSVVCTREAYPRNFLRNYLLIPLSVQHGIIVVAIVATLVHNIWLISPVQNKKAARRMFYRSLATAICFLIPSLTYVILFYSQMNRVTADARNSILGLEPKVEWMVITVLILAAIIPIATMLPLLIQARNFEVIRGYFTQLSSKGDSGTGTL